MVEASCHCGAVRLQVDDAPAEVTDCNCSICRRYGVLWAYYAPGQVRIAGGATDIYMWGDRCLLITSLDVSYAVCRSRWSPYH